MSRVIWLAVGAGVVALISVVVRRARARAARPDVGAVSHQWVADQMGRPDGGFSG